MSKSKPVIEFDVAVIGAGQAGPTLAMNLAGRGEKVALIEGGLVGGSCVNYGCTRRPRPYAKARGSRTWRVVRATSASRPGRSKSTSRQ